MLQKIRYLLGQGQTRPIFVIGTGRSGTHWLAGLLKSHREIRATIEVKPMFRWATQMAIDPSTESQLLPKLIFAYRRQLYYSAPRLYLDKSHPNIWLVEHLKAAFPDAQFLAIERNPFATVASMLRHRGVALWHQRWRDFPVPNRFLGITVALAETYNELPLTAQCAHRWLAHHQRTGDLQGTLGGDLLVTHYEDLAQDTNAALTRLQSFLGLQTPVAPGMVKSESLEKWRTQLTNAQIDQIAAVVGSEVENTTKLVA